MPQSKRHPARRPQQRSAKPSHKPSGRPDGRPPARPSARTAASTSSSAWRRRLEIRSAGPLALLNNMPGWIVPVLLAVLLVAGLFLKGWLGAIALLPVGLFLLWLLLLAWPVLNGRGRLIRVAVVVLVGGAMVGKVLGLL